MCGSVEVMKRLKIVPVLLSHIQTRTWWPGLAAGRILPSCPLASIKPNFMQNPSVVLP